MIIVWVGFVDYCLLRLLVIVRVIAMFPSDSIMHKHTIHGDVQAVKSRLTTEMCQASVSAHS